MKYNNKKTSGYDSKKEFFRSLVLKQMLKDGEISDLKEQERFRFEVNGKLICSYVSDFSYIENGKYIVEDVKSKITAKAPVYRIKNKMMKAFYNIDIREFI